MAGCLFMAWFSTPGSLSLGVEREIRSKPRTGVAAGRDSELARLYDPLAFCMPDCKFGLRHIEAHGRGLMRLQVNA